MAYRSLREFLDRLERAGELVRVREPVDLRLDMAALADRAAKQEGPALLFERPSSGELPVAMNLFGTRRRTSWALSCEDFEEPARELRELLHLAPPQGLWEKLKMIPRLGKLASYTPRHVSGGPVQEVVDREPDLSRLPVLTTWPHDGGPFVTLPQVITRDPETGIRNVGMYRLQVLGPRRLAMHWQLHKTATAHYRGYKKKGERMPVAIALGGDPALTYCASAPLPPNVDEYLFAGFLRGEAVQLVKGIATGLDVPADVELLIAPLAGVGPKWPLSSEILAPILAWYVVDDFQSAVNLSIDLNFYGGVGHTCVIYSRDDAKIREYGLRMPAGRLRIRAPRCMIPRRRLRSIE